MNKITTLLLFFVASLSVLAQDDSSKKPTTKDFTAEVNFNPFSSNPVNINYLRFRTFTSERTAVRLGVSIGLENDKPAEDLTRNTFEINLRPGYEWHFTGTERLSPYFGVEADIAIKRSKVTDDDEGAFITEVKGAWDGFGTERGFTRFGANFIIGADFYIARRLYLGTEFGYGFEAVNSSDIEYTAADGSDIDPDKGGSSFQIGPNFNSSLRLGFVF